MPSSSAWDPIKISSCGYGPAYKLEPALVQTRESPPTTQKDDHRGEQEKSRNGDLSSCCNWYGARVAGGILPLFVFLVAGRAPNGVVLGLVL